MDSDGSGIVTNDEFKRFVTRTLGLTPENADDVLGSLCQASYAIEHGAADVKTCQGSLKPECFV